MEGHRLNMIGQQERQARINRSATGKKSKDRPDRIFAPTLVVKDTDNYKPLDGNEGHSINRSNAGASAFDKMSKRLEAEMSRQHAEMSRQHADMSRQHADMSRRLDETLKLMRQLHPRSSATAATRMAMEEDTQPYPPRTGRTTGEGIWAPIEGNMSWHAT